MQAKGDDAKWVRNKEFPWYRKLETMLGGRSARGNRLNETYEEEIPSIQVPPTEASVLGSEQGSSDDPEEFPNDNDDSDSVRQDNCRAGSSYRQGGQSSEGTFPSSRSSGSKRKSTDESHEEKSKGKTFKENYRRKQKQLEKLAEAGLEIAKAMREKNKFRKAKEPDYCLLINRMRNLEITGSAHDYCMAAMKDSWRAVWFLSASETEILEWLNRNNIFHNREYSNNNPGGFSSLLDNNRLQHGHTPHSAGMPPPSPFANYNYSNTYGAYGMPPPPPNN